MLFKLNHHCPQLELPSDHAPGRWQVATVQHMEEETGGRWRWWLHESRNQQAGQRLTLTLGLDCRVTLGDGMPRPVVMRTVKYQLEDLRSPEGVCRRRRILEAQVELLNCLQSPLLPEPLDWLEVLNTSDHPFPRLLRGSEPVLILDWLPGERLDWLITRRHLHFLKKDDNDDIVLDERRQAVRSDEVHTPRIARIARRLVSYLELLRDRKVVCFDLNPRHILLLKDDIPRFLGLGRLCPLRADTGLVDVNHPNYLRTSRGYVPPEVTEPGPRGDFPGARTATPASVGAFALGAILLQMLCDEAELPDSWIAEGTLRYPNEDAERRVRQVKDGDALHDLLIGLCARDPARRLTDLGQIDRQLADIARDRDALRYSGQVKFYDSVRGFGFITCEDSRIGDVFVGQAAVERSRLATLYDRQRVSFEVRRSRRGDSYEAWALRVIPLMVPSMPVLPKPSSGRRRY